VSVQSVGKPVTLRIPSINVTAAVEHVGRTDSGAMDEPKEWQNVAWYEPGTRPGEKGNAVMAGHLDSDSGKAIFWDLHLLTPGDVVEVVDDRGETIQFAVKEVRKMLDADAPVKEIFGKSDVSRLNLITCGGKWDEKTQRYDKRLVVFTERITDDVTSQARSDRQE
jgi:sortase A